MDAFDADRRLMAADNALSGTTSSGLVNQEGSGGSTLSGSSNVYRKGEEEASSPLPDVAPQESSFGRDSEQSPLLMSREGDLSSESMSSELWKMGRSQFLAVQDRAVSVPRRQIL